MKKLFILSLIALTALACNQTSSNQVATPIDESGIADTTGMEGAMHRFEARGMVADISIDPIEGGTTIADVYANPSNFDGKKIIVKAMITKINTAIMNKNWLHLQDGTSSSGQFDLTATTDHSFEVGSIVTVEGTIALDKDFGYGYTYQVLLEDVKLIKVSADI